MYDAIGAVHDESVTYIRKRKITRTTTVCGIVYEKNTHKTKTSTSRDKKVVKPELN